MASPPSSMLTARFRGGGIIDFERTHVPQPGPGHLLLRITACALCGSDRHQLEHGSSVTPGHEAAGTVAACGPGTSTPVGTPGVVYLMDFCGACRSCRCGATNQCLAKRGDFGFSPDGGYAEYALVRETAFFATPEGIDGGTATLLLDIMGTGGHAMARAQQVHQDIRSVYVAGAGPIGLGVLAMARLLLGGDVPIAVGDVVPYRLDLAGRLGGVPVDVSAAPVVEGLRARGLDGVDAAIDTTGKEAARRDALGALAQRGVLVCVGHGEGCACRCRQI